MGCGGVTDPLYINTDLYNLKVACMCENLHSAIQDHQSVMFVVAAEKEATCRQWLTLPYLHVKNFLAS